MLHWRTLLLFCFFHLIFLAPLTNQFFSFYYVLFSINASLLFCSSTSSSLSFISPSYFSITTLSFSRFSLTPLPITLPLLIVIALQCFLGIVWVLAVNVPHWWSVNWFAIFPMYVSNILIDAFVFFWFAMDICINWFKVSSNFEVLSGCEGFWLKF